MKTEERSGARRVDLKGAYNFRDLGGYATSGGKKIAWGKLFRSDNLARLTNGDLVRIERLNLRTVIDLRSEEERESRPNRLPGGNGLKIRNVAIANPDKGHNELKREIFYGKLGGMDLGQALMGAYERAVTDYHDAWRTLFEVISDPETYPALVLCNAGKDRTGVMIALTLAALGVPRKTVEQDYLLSKACLEPMVTRMVSRVRWMSLFRADIVQLKKMLDTRIEYLRKTFSTIDREFGSTEAFLSAMGMDESKRKLLIDTLCG